MAHSPLHHSPSQGRHFLGPCLLMTKNPPRERAWAVALCYSFLQRIPSLVHCHSGLTTLQDNGWEELYNRKRPRLYKMYRLPRRQKSHAEGCFCCSLAMGLLVSDRSRQALWCPWNPSSAICHCLGCLYQGALSICHTIDMLGFRLTDGASLPTQTSQRLLRHGLHSEQQKAIPGQMRPFRNSHRKQNTRKHSYFIV